MTDSNAPELGPQARAHYERYRGPTRAVTRIAKVALRVAALGWLFGVLPWWLMVVAGLGVVLPPAIYGGVGGRKIAQDHADR